MKELIERFNTMSPNNKILYVDRWEPAEHTADEQEQPLIVMDEVVPITDEEFFILREKIGGMFRVTRDDLGELKEKQ